MSPAFLARRRALAAVGLALLTAGCGFQLRRPRPLPFQTLHLAMNPYQELTAMLKRAIAAGSPGTRLVDVPSEAEAVLSVVADVQEEAILSLNSEGRVRELELRRRFAYRLTDSKGVELAPTGQIVLRRELTFNDSLVLAKDAEKQMLFKDMQGDLVQQLLRRLALAKAAPADED